jgi:succinoglycan biosynthesis transport protein ExoP
MTAQLHTANASLGRTAPREETPLPAPHLVSLVSATSFPAEQYRILRHTVEQRHRDQDVRVVAVTSPGGREGKTSTSINLAGALAQARETRVLLFEADLRRPSILRQLGLSTEGCGLVDAVLDASLGIADVVRSCPDYNLHVLPAGDPPLAPYEVLKSHRMGELLQEARAAYDYIVVDTPPVVPCPDYRLLEKLLDGTVLVVAADKTPRQVVDAAAALIDPAKMLGLVFNGDNGRDTRYQDHYYAAPPAARRPLLRHVSDTVASLRRSVPWSSKRR